MSTDPNRKLRIGVFGLGRMGKRHARNIAFFSPRSELVAVSDPKAEELVWAKSNLPSSVQTFSSSEELLENTECDAILVSTDTAYHSDLAVKAMNAGKHVLIEKPISIDLNESVPVIQAAEAHPELKVMIAFSRRFDASYQDAAKKIKDGLLGETYLIKSCTNDYYDPTPYFMGYAKNSGGIFIDCAIHDIDIGRWLLNVDDPAKLKSAKKQVTRVFATGQNIRYHGLAEMGDCDNALGLIEFENGSKMNIHLSRTSMHGHDVICEVFGSESKLVINANPNMNRVEIRDVHGVRSESHLGYYDRFREAFTTEIQTFTDCCLDDLDVPTPPSSGLEAARIAIGLQHSFRVGKPIEFNENGEPILV